MEWIAAAALAESPVLTADAKDSMSAVLDSTKSLMTSLSSTSSSPSLSANLLSSMSASSVCPSIDNFNQPFPCHRFYEVIVHPRLVAGPSVFVDRAGRKSDDRDFPEPLFPDRPGCRDTVGVGHLDVHEDEVEGIPGMEKFIDDFPSVCGSLDPATFLAQKILMSFLPAGLSSASSIRGPGLMQGRTVSFLLFSSPWFSTRFARSSTKLSLRMGIRTKRSNPAFLYFPPMV